MSEHSKLPWRFEPLTCDDDRGMGYIVDADGNVVDHHGDSAKWKHENLANAELKVLACNTHAQLVEACRAMLNSSDYENDERPLMQNIRAALAAAEGKP